VTAKWWTGNGSPGGDFVPLGLFYVTPNGIAMVLGGLVYFLLIGCRLLPNLIGKEEGGVVSAKLRALYGEEVGQGFDCVVPIDFPDQTLEQLDLRVKYPATALGVAGDKGRKKIMVPLGTTRVGPGDVVALGTGLSLSAAGLVALMIILIGKVMHIDEVYKAVEWKTIFLVAGLIPLGAAFEKTGAADFLAKTVLLHIDNLTPILLYLILILLTSFFGMFVSNVGATVLLVPLAMNMASQVGADPRIAGMVVAVASINTFILPTHQVNALIMQPGGYKTTDYIRVGSGFMLLFAVIFMTMLVVFY
jgi:di/tricarboxylate transporter